MKINLIRSDSLPAKLFSRCCSNHPLLLRRSSNSQSKNKPRSSRHLRPPVVYCQVSSNELSNFFCWVPQATQESSCTCNQSKSFSVAVCSLRDQFIQCNLGQTHFFGFFKGLLKEQGFPSSTLRATSPKRPNDCFARRENFRAFWNESAI